MLKKIPNTDECKIPNVGSDVVIKLVDVCKKFNNSLNCVVKNINLEVKKGEILSILGDTGSGKTTILRMISGFETPDSGEIIIGHQYVYKDKSIINPEKRGIGIMFQQYTLFPHMSVYKNIEFGISSLSKENRTALINKVAEQLNIIDILGSYPYQLSGGQQQKVSIARVLVMEPKIILFDEAFSSLDKSIRTNLRLEIKNIVKENGLTAIFVTHDHEEALSISDRIAVLYQGSIVQADIPSNLYKNPANLYVATFLSKANLVKFDYKNTNLGTEVDVCSSGQKILMHDTKYSNIENSVLLIRPEDIEIFKDNVDNSVRVKVHRICFLGFYTEVCVLLNGEYMKSLVLGVPDFVLGQEVFIKFKDLYFLSLQ